MLTLLIDRDSGHAGDDTESHLRVWTFPDHATLGDLVLRVVAKHYLAAVEGDVAWRLDLLHEAEARPGADGTPRAIDRASGEVEEFAPLTVRWARGTEETTVQHVSPRYHVGSGSELARAIRPGHGGVRTVLARYLMGGRPWTLAEYRAQYTLGGGPR